jgi:hypothetical protein
VAGLLASLWAGFVTAQPSSPRTGGSQTKNVLSLTILDPRGEASLTTRAAVNILGRISPGAKVTVGGEAARVFATGVFVRDNVPVQMGENRIAVLATGPNGQKAEQIVTVNRLAPTTPPPEPTERRLEIEASSVEPAQNVILSRGDILELSFRGTPGQSGEYALSAGSWRPMAEVLDESSGRPSGLYRASLAATPLSDATNSPVRFRLQTKTSETNGVKIIGQRIVEVASRAGVGFSDEAKLRLVRVVEDGAPMSFGLHEVRLGGPYLAELSRGTVLRVTGMKGDSYQVRLSPDVDGWVGSRDVEWAPAGTPVPHLSFTDVSAYGNDQVDVVAIPYGSAGAVRGSAHVEPGRARRHRD